MDSGRTGARQLGSGGKIIRTRRSAASRMPYDRPDWISRVVYRPARAIASGANKLISFIVFSDSSSSSSSDADYSSDTDDDDKNNADSPEDETMEENGEFQMDLVNHQQPIMPRTSSKHLIEKLLMQETFRRKECDRLLNIIKERVVDHPDVPATEEGRHSTFLDNKFTKDVSSPGISNKAVMEAKKLLEERNSGSSSKYEPGYGSMLLDSSVLPHLKGSGSGQSWNIQEEIHKVRAIATEELLKKVPSSTTMIDTNFSVNDMKLKANTREMIHPCTNAIDPSLNTYGGASSSFQAVQNMLDGCPAISISQLNQTPETEMATDETQLLRTKSCIGDHGSKETLVSTKRVKSSKDLNNAPQSGTNGRDGEITYVVLALGGNADSKDMSETNHRTSKESGEIGPGTGSSGFRSQTIPVEEHDKDMSSDSEAPAENRSKNEDESVTNSSQNSLSSSWEDEWLPEHQSVSNSPSSSSNGTTTTKVLVYSRRGRGRGRGRSNRGRGRGRGQSK